MELNKVKRNVLVRPPDRQNWVEEEEDGCQRKRVSDVEFMLLDRHTQASRRVNHWPSTPTNTRSPSLFGATSAGVTGVARRV